MDHHSEHVRYFVRNHFRYPGMFIHFYALKNVYTLYMKEAYRYLSIDTTNIYSIVL